MKPQPHPAWMMKEIAEQPRILETRAAAWQAMCDAQALGGDPVALIGRGSSGHACAFFSYLYGLSTGRPTMEFRPWIATQPAPQASCGGTVAVAFSASGESGDVVQAAQWMRERGARVIGVTNRAGISSPLGRASDALMRFDVGEERAIPATKTFLAQLFIAAALAGFRIEPAARRAAAAIASMLEGKGPDRVASFLQGARSIFWIARGPAVAVARDAALKCQEAAALPSQGYSSAEVLHGPVGALGPSDRVVMLHDTDEPAESMGAVAAAMLGRGVPTLTVGGAESLRGRSDGIELDMPEVRWPRAIVLASLSQQVALLLALRDGRNPDLPSGLQKVTTTF